MISELIKLFLTAICLQVALSNYNPVIAGGKTDALLLTCMDYRLINDAVKYMNERGLKDKYDQLILAGASLRATTEKYPAWNETFWQHLEVSIQLHHIETVILMDHRDCGAYKVIFEKDFYKNKEEETKIHTEHLKKLAGMIKKKYPKLKVETLLMNLDGSVEEI